MRKNLVVTRTLVSILIGAIGAPNAALAAQWPLAQYPAGSASREPAPNVIVSVDDSGSMGATGIATLKDALKQTFVASNVPDDQIRLAWQSMNRCSGIPSDSTACGNKNGMKPLSGAHRTNFFTWVDTLVQGNGTPSHQMVRNAGDYLKRTDLAINSPWASLPGTTLNPVISCRKSFHIFMTDGGWNSSEPTDTSKHIDGDRKTLAYRALGIGSGSTSGNIDGSSFTLGDGLTPYTANSSQTKIYYDQWGFGDTDGLNTLSDLTFYYWATDLQPSIANDLKPTIKKSGDETFGTGSSATTIPEFWNPKNDPATWQHMVNYTIGFGAGASAWTGSPVFDKADPYGGDFSKLIQGTTTWPSPLCGNNSKGSGNNACDAAAGYSVRDNERRVELWHTAINGRGKFVPAPDAAALVTAFKDIIGTIIADTSTPITSFTSASSSVTRTGTEQYSSGYAASKWSGYVKSDKLAQRTGTTSASTDWGIKTGVAAPNNYITTADKLDALAATDITNRLILTTNDATSAGVSFEWSTGTALLSAAQKTLLNTDTKGQDRVNFLRGDRTKEGNTTLLPFRIRDSRQGDIVNSAVWYVGTPASNYSFDNYRTFASSHKARLPMLYVGGNDGMLHGFSAKDGSEKIAYVPKGVINNLPALSGPSYTHAYYVDGSPFSGDVNWGTTSPDWHTLLIGSLGAGGKGYFVLDVTKPGTTATDGTGTATNFAKSNAASLVVMDNTVPKDDATGDADIGHIMAAPVVDDTNLQKVTQITRMNNGRWAVVMGNGYNSTNERPVLLIQYLDGNKELKKIAAAPVKTGTPTSTDAIATGNGLSAPRLVDINGDGKPDVVYAGDLQGNMWKFDVSSALESEWSMAFSGSPLFTAVHTSGSSSSAQPITAPPIVKPNDRGVGGLMVAFGTGRNLTEGDRTDTASKQSIYSVLDNTRYKLSSGKVVIDTSLVTPAAVGTGVSNLKQQTVVTTTSFDGSGVSTGRKFWNVSQEIVDYEGTGTGRVGAKKGWYLNLPETGERILDPMSFYDGSNNLEVLSEVPGSGGSVAEESCNPPVTLPRKYRTFLNIMDGKKPGVQILDVNGDGAYSAAVDKDKGVSRMEASIKEGRTTNTKTETRKGSDGKEDKFAKMPELPMRPSWRQLQ
ncbi:PilC/PilY family type IV pilus protein [Polaromonas sp.]|uniref:pilus assembly protein n=1 Tax=Polaromonas sp. TaxID=1869339 RepID=UPI0017C66EE5|nr:PilC/PilY family type IV pilus protein [Polaromonas sp.]NMM08465.1 pilus assembly protein PilC [Polaromonas sp.]